MPNPNMSQPVPESVTPPAPPGLSVDSILKRLRSKSGTAHELLPVYQAPEYASLWQADARLYVGFARKLISEGHPTQAFEIAREGQTRHPTDPDLKYLLALARARGGSLRAAQDSLRSLLSESDLPPRLRVEVLSLEGRLYKDLYERTRNPVRKKECAILSAVAYRKAAAQPGADFFPLINGATMTFLSCETEQAKELAREAIEQAEQARLQPDRAQDYWISATLGEAHALRGEFDKASKWYTEAVNLARAQGAIGDIGSMRRNALLLKDKLAVQDELLRLFYVGSVVVFAGHMLDHPARTTREGLPLRFPSDPQLIRMVSEAIKQALDQLNVTVGYCSAACGSDILFAEHMLDRHAELHIVLPFAQEDFYATSVDFGLPGMIEWRPRFDAVLKRATEVHFATTEPYLGHDVLFGFVNSFTQGLALIRAGQRGVSPQALVVLDPGTRRQPGGTQYFLETWTKGGHPARTIELDRLRWEVFGEDAPAAVPAAETRSPVSGGAGGRKVQSMLFADVKDYSKLPEGYSPDFFVRFLEEMAGVIHSLQTAPVYVNTAGDGLFLVFDHVGDCAEAAMRLLERAEQLPWKEWRFKEVTPLRIGVHAGPVFSGLDPIIRRQNYFGSHVNRAARIEPVTTPGCAFTSEQFAALLAVEAAESFVCEYVGVEKLHKDFDNHCPLYRLARR